MVATGTMGIGFWVIYLAAIFGLMYFIAIRPQKKEKKKIPVPSALKCVKAL